MWVKFDKLQEEEKVSTRTGKNYQCFVLYGTRLGGSWGGDSPYSRIIFEQSTADITKKDNTTTANSNIVDFIKHDVVPGDVLEFKMKRNPTIAKLFDIQSISFVRNPNAATGDTSDDVPFEGSAQQASSSPTPPWIK